MQWCRSIEGVTRALAQLATGSALAGLICTLPQAFAEEAPGAPAIAGPAVVDQVQGTLRAERDGRTLRLVAKDSVRTGDVLLTTSASRAQIQLPTAGGLQIGPSSRLRITQLDPALPVALSLHTGFLNVTNTAVDAPHVRVEVPNWSIDVGTGDALVQADETQVTLCADPASAVLIDGASADTPNGMPASCVQLRRGRAPSAFDVDAAGLALAREQLDLRKVLGRAAIRAAAPSAEVEPVPRPAPPPPVIVIEAPESASDPAPALAADLAPVPATPAPPEGSAPVTGASAAVLARAEIGRAPVPTAPAVPGVAAPTAPVAAPAATVAAPSPGATVSAEAAASPSASLPASAVDSGATSPPLAPTTPVAAEPTTDPLAPAPPSVAVSDGTTAATPATAAGGAVSPATGELAVSAVPAASLPPRAESPVGAASEEGADAIPQPPHAGPEWIVNVASFGDGEAGARAVARLTEGGFAAALRQETVRGRASWRAVITGFSTETQANQAARRVVSDYGYRTAWALRTR